MKHLKLIFACLLTAVFSIGQVWAEKITAVANIESGKQYYIGSTKSNSTDYYLQVTGRGATDGKVKGVAVTDVSDADVFTFTQTSGGWTIKFSNGKYLVLPSAKDNGKVYVQADAGDWTIANASSLLSLKYGDFYLQNNKATNTTNFGMYASGQLDLWLEPVSSGSSDACANPTFLPVAGAVLSGTTVAISCATDGATIHYTTDGTDPTTSSPTYSSAITISSATTIKALAVKSGLSNSSVATAAYTIATPLTTMDAIFAAATTAGSTATDKFVTFNNWVVSAASGSNAFVTDGTKGFIIYASSHGFNAGDVLNGTVACKVQLYKGSAELTNVTSATEGLTVTAGGTVAVNTLTIDQLGAINTGAVVKIENVAYDGTNLSDGTNTIKPYNKLFGYSMESGKDYNVTGVINYYDALQIMPRSAEDVKEVTAAGAPEAPTFSPAAGEYTAVQSVELSCATAGATIYYTTDGSTPDNTSTEYTAAITVGANMTIKAIAIKDAVSSAIASASYVINLPADPETTQTWDLSIDETASASTTELTWTSTYVDMSFAKGSATTNANNYYPGTSGQSYTSTRAYKNGIITLTPTGKQITTIVFEATSQGYATALKNSTWTNATATSSGSTVTVTASSIGAVSAVLGGTTGFTSVTVNYGPIDASIPEAPTFSPVAGTYTSVQSVELSCATAGATIYYTTDGSTPDNTATEYTSAITVDASMTIKAIAIKDAKSGPVATAAYIINLPVTLSTIQAVYDKAVEVSSTVTDVTIAFNDWVVSGVNGNAAYVTDGTKGFVIYGSGHGFVVNDKISGTVACKVQLYKGYAEVTELTADNAALTVTNDGVVTPLAATIASLGAVNTGAPIILNNVQFNGSVLSDGVNSITPYTTFYADAVTSLESGKYYNITGIYVHFNTTKEVAPRSAADIEELTLADPELSYSPAMLEIEVGDSWSAPTFDNPHSLTVTFSGNNDAVATVDPASGDIALAGGTGTAVITAHTDGDATYAAGSATYTITVNPAGTSQNVVILATYNSKHYAMPTAVNSSGACEAIEVEYDGTQVTVASAEDKVAIQWTKKTVSDNTTFQVADGKYLKGTSGGASLSLVADACNWSWDETKGYYYIPGSTVRSFFYKNDGIFKNYAVSNLTNAAYAGVDVIVIDPANIVITSKVSAELAYSPASATIELGGAWSAPSLENPHSVTITSYGSDNEAVATVTDGGVIALAGGIGTAHITAHFAGDATYLEGDAVYTITVNEVGDDLSGTWVLASSVAAGDKIIIANVAVAGELLTMGAQNGNYREQVASTVDGDNKLTPANGTKVLTLVDASSIDASYEGFALQATNGNYLSAASSSSNNIKEVASVSDKNAVWSIVISEGVAAIVAQGSYSRKVIRYNSGNTRFSCYAEENSMADVVIYKKGAAPEPPTPAYEDARTGLTAGNYYTICLPKKVTAFQGASFWNLKNRNEEGDEVYLEEAELPFAAGTPFIILAEDTKLEVVYEGDATTTPVESGALRGTLTGMTYEQLAAAGTNIYILKENAIRKITDGNWLSANRAYIDYDALNVGVPNSAPGRRVIAMPMQGESAQGIDNVGASEKPMKMMINGQLFIIRGEKMYDVTGKLVK